MAKIFYNNNLNIDTPTIILKKKDFSNIGKVIASEIKYKNNFASANELSFKVYKFLDEDLNSLWEEINDYNIIYIPEYEEFFDIHVSLNEEIGTYKTVTCTALAESELSNVKLYDIEINTEADILRDDYDADYPTIFYRDLHKYVVGSEMYNKLKNASLLHRILDKASNYEIGHIDVSLMQLKEPYEFSISDTNIYDELTGEIAEQYKCLFTFDIDEETGRRTVNAYDLCNTCVIEKDDEGNVISGCGYRGEFYDVCPECGSTNFSGAYGKDTVIFSSKENLATSSSIESNKDQLKNCFRVTGGDDMITSTVSLINPSGSNYYFYFSPETLASMPDDLRTKIESYSSESNKCLNNTAYVLNSTNVNNYNSVVQYINTRFPETDEEGNVVDKFSEINSSITGYKNVTPIIYDAIDIYYYLQHSMMPTPELDNQSIDDALKLLTVNNLSPIAVSSPSSSGIDSIVNNAVIGMAKTFINTALYKVEVEEDKTTYTPGETTGIWKGVLKLTSIRNNEDTRKTSTLTLTVDGDKERYIKQKISRILSRNDNVIRQITDIKMPLDEFKERIQYYSAVYLEDTANAFGECIEIINTSDIKELADNMKSLYQERIDLLGEVTEKDADGNIVKVSDGEISKRLQQMTYITNIQTELDAIKSNVRDILDFEAYLGEDLWKVFCSYRREDSYQNSNYISDGLTNAKLMQRTQALVDEAQKELYKAGNLQYNISSTLNNLLALEEFQPIVNDFECGNWIHVMIDEKLYNLRLLSYEIDYDNLDKIAVEFSTVTKIWSGVSDVKNILESAQSIASSYSSTISQVKQSTKASKYVNNWVDEGFSLTANKIVNNVDNQDIVIDKTGILCRSYDDIEELYDDCQFKFISNGAYFTDDNWKSIKAGIGKFIYLDPQEGFVEKVGYGVIADTITSNIVLTKEIGVYSKDGGVIINGDGITLDGGKITWTQKLPSSSVDGLDDRLNTFVDEVVYNEKIDEIQKQIDKSITTWFYDSIPTLNSLPASEWKTDDDKNTHLGDLYYDNKTGYAYRFQFVDSEYSWIKITDSDVTKALADAKNAQDTADKKRRVFVDTPVPPYEVGDLWTGGEKGDLKRCKITKLSGVFSENDWEIATKYTDNTKANEVESSLNSYKTEITNFQNLVNANLSVLNGALPVTTIGQDYIISPKIGGGYLYITGTGGSVEINPNLTNYTGNSGYIFNIKNPSGQTVIGTDANGNATFNGIVNAQSGGTICDWNINNNAIYKGIDSLNSSNEGTYIGTDGILQRNSNNEHLLLQNGAITLTGNYTHTDISGKIYYGKSILQGGRITLTMQDTTLENSSVGEVVLSPDGLTLFYKDTYTWLYLENKTKSIKLYDGSTYWDIQSSGVARLKTIYENGILLSEKYAPIAHTHNYLSLSGGIVSGNIHISTSNETNNWFIAQNSQNNVHFGVGSNGTKGIYNNEFQKWMIYSVTNNDSVYIGSGANVYVQGEFYINLISSFSYGASIYLNDYVNIVNKSGHGVSMISERFSPQANDAGLIDCGGNNTRWRNIYSVSAPISSSDRKLKDNIKTLSDTHKQLFMKLIPVSFTFKDGTSGRTHIGFISQDVENAMAELGMTSLDFAGFCKDIKKEYFIDENGNEVERDIFNEDGTPVYLYSLRYEEFISLNTYMIQCAINRLETIEDENQKLKLQVSFMQEQINTIMTKLEAVG